MIKRILVILCLLMLTSCGVNKNNLFKLTINDEDIYVGYSKIDDINTSFDEIEVDDKGIITSLTIYPKDYDSTISINNVDIDNSISVNSLMYKGYDSNGACVVEKNVSGRVNRIVFYNNILNDDLDALDHITLSFN